MVEFTGREILQPLIDAGIPAWWYEGSVEIFDTESKSVQKLNDEQRLLFVAYYRLCGNMNSVIDQFDHTFSGYSEPKTQPLGPVRQQLKEILQATKEFELARRYFWSQVRKFSTFPREANLAFLISGKSRKYLSYYPRISR